MTVFTYNQSAANKIRKSRTRKAINNYCVNMTHCEISLPTDGSPDKASSYVKSKSFGHKITEKLPNDLARSGLPSGRTRSALNKRYNKVAARYARLNLRKDFRATAKEICLPSMTAYCMKPSFDRGRGEAPATHACRRTNSFPNCTP